MTRPWGHSATYHAWPASTPVIDAIVTVVAVASVVIGAHAALFLVLALQNDDGTTALYNALFLVAVLLVNCFVEAVRHWYRHHG